MTTFLKCWLAWLLTAALLFFGSILYKYIDQEGCSEAKERWEIYIPARQAYCWLRKDIQDEQFKNLP